MASVTTTVPRAEAPAWTRALRANLQTYMLIFALIIIWVIFAVGTQGVFLQAQNISNLFRQMSITAILSVGMVLVIVTGNIDLSVGYLAGFVSVAVSVAEHYWWPQLFPDSRGTALTLILSVGFGIGIGTLVGVFQGIIIAWGGVPAFITTLGASWMLSGAMILITQGQMITVSSPAFKDIAQSYLPPDASWILAVAVIAFLFGNMFFSRSRKARYGFELPAISLDILKTIGFSAVVCVYVYVVNQFHGVQFPVLLLAGLALAVTYLSNNTRFGRHAYAIGGNREAARLSGINIKGRLFSIFVLMGLLSGVSGIVLAARVGGGTAGAGQGYELEAIAACILGGTSTLGGEGTILGAMVGALIMATLTNGLQLIGLQPEWQFLVKGAVLVLAVFLDVRLRRNR